MSRLTRRWEGALAATVLLGATGLLASNAALLLSGVVPLAYAAYGTTASVDVPDLSVERRIEPSPAPPGHPIRVELVVTNDSDRTVPDCRVVDAVPEELAVTRGTPRAGVTLAPGDSCTLTYEVIARRGEHRFDAPAISIRSLGGGAVAEADVVVDGDSMLDCRLEAGAPPLQEQADGFVGQLATDRPGRGIEFHSVRRYATGDPARRIDWRQYAKRGELATVNYEQRGAANVVLVVDARPVSRVVSAPGRPTAVELAAYAATRALSDLLGAGHEVGVAVVGGHGDGPAGLHWVEPGNGASQRSRALDAFRRATEVHAEDVDADAQFRQLLSLTGPRTQFALVSPVLDDDAVRAVETWRAFDHPAIVLSPDVVPENTVSGEFETVNRRTRLARCQATGARTIDWRRGTPLPIAIEYAFAASARVGSRPAAPSGGAP